MKQLFTSIFTVILLNMASPAALAQDTMVTRVKQLVSALNKNKEALPHEQVYLQTDKPYYSVDDTLWLKAYILNQDLAVSNKSGILYMEFLNDSSRLVKRLVLPLVSSVGWANVVLAKEDFTEGAYTLRCYTNWQRNFGEERFYTKSINIGGSSETGWLVNSLVTKDKQQVKANLQFRKLDQLSLGLQDMRIRVYHGRHELYSQKMTTKIDGSLDVNFLLPDKVNGGLVIKAESVKPGEQRSVTIPLRFVQPNDIDLQFMPEGGSLTAGLPSRVAFKALDPEGLGADIEGKILDSEQHEVLSFHTTHKGMGTFEFKPEAGEVYTAVIVLANGTRKISPLPLVQVAGTRLRIDNDDKSDSLILHLSTTPGKTGRYIIMAQARQTVGYAAVLPLSDQETIKKIAKDLFPTGITRFTLLDAFDHPLNERIVFIDHHDNLNITPTADRQDYQTGDSVSLNLHVTDQDEKPITGIFSVAVTDDAQIKPDNNRENILTAMMLSSGLKGTIEEPGYYLDTNNPEVWKSLDVLLLAQGWTSYNWKQATDTTFKAAWPAEKEFTVQGKVTNLFGKGVNTTQVVLFSNKPVMIRDTVTDAKGRFVFNNLVPMDTVAYHVQARNRNGKSFNVGIELDLFKEPATLFYKNQLLPWYVNTDSTITSYIHNNNKQQNVKNNIPPGSNMLKEVKIKAKKIIKGSKNLNGPGNSDFALDQKEMEKAGKQTLLDVLETRVQGFHIGGKYSRWYFINDEPLFLVVDGIALHKTQYRLTFEDYRAYLQSVSAENVVGIEEIFGNAGRYEIEYLGGIPDSPCSFIEVTTRSGKGPYMASPTPGTYLYKPIPFAMAKDFYRPRYTVKNTASLANDLRSTIHWEPNVITNAEGKAIVSFYAAGKPGTYTVLLEGTDLNGHIGYKSTKIKVINSAKP